MASFGKMMLHDGKQRTAFCPAHSYFFRRVGAARSFLFLTSLPVSLSQEEHEDLLHQNEARHEWIEQLGAQNRSISSKWYQRVADLRVSTTDPDASLMLTKDGAHLGYHTHYVVDGEKSRIILQALVTPPK